MIAELAIDSKDRIGEAPVWIAASQRLLWSDHQTGIVHEASQVGQKWEECRRWETGRLIAATLPRRNGGYAIVGGREISLMSEKGETTLLSKIDVDPKLVKFNDAKCDVRGRIWSGTFSADFRKDSGDLYRIDPDGTATRMETGFTLANGLDWSPDATQMYISDSLKQRIEVLEFDAEEGLVSSRRTLIHIADGLPNGLCVDVEGHIWVAITGAGEVRRYTPAGNCIASIAVPVAGVTSCAFGGENGDILFMTTRSGSLPAVVRELGLKPKMMENEGPGAGGVFLCRPLVHGKPATLFGSLP